MRQSRVLKILSAIPERVARAKSGTRFAARPAGAPGGQVAHLSRHLQWLSPLASLTREDQGALGLLAPGKAAQPDEDEEADAEVDGYHYAPRMTNRLGHT
jgi:hypothetical protein